MSFFKDFFAELLDAAAAFSVIPLPGKSQAIRNLWANIVYHTRYFDAKERLQGSICRFCNHPMREEDLFWFKVEYGDFVLYHENCKATIPKAKQAVYKPIEIDMNRLPATYFKWSLIVWKDALNLDDTIDKRIIDYYATRVPVTGTQQNSKV